MSPFFVSRTPWEAVRGSSIENANRLGELALQANSVEEQLEGLLALSYCRALESNTAASVELLREATFLAKSVDSDWQPRVHYLHGVVLRELGEFVLSIEAHETAIRKARRFGQIQEIPAITQSLGFTLFRMNLRKEALELWLMIEDEISQSELRSEYGHLLAMIAHCNLLEKNYSEAETRYQRAIDVFESLADDIYTTMTKSGLAVVWLMQGDAQSAIVPLRRACLLAESEMRARSEAVWLHYLGMALLQTGEWEEAEETLLRSAAKCVEMRVPELLRQCYSLLIEERERRGDLQGALHFANQYMSAVQDLAVMGAKSAEIAMRAVQLAQDLQET